jgi:SAM-dependent methyltransferase
MSEGSYFTEQVAHWDRWASFYDDDSQDHLDPEPATDMLAELAAGGPALELGIGTGRLALPLARRGIPVTGLDASPQMLARLHEGRETLPVDVHLADMADFRLPDTFPLAYIAASTIFLLGSGERQASCFRSVAAALSVGGRFVVEAALPSTLATAAADHNAPRRCSEGEEVKSNVAHFGLPSPGRTRSATC